MRQLTAPGARTPRGFVLALLIASVVALGFVAAGPARGTATDKAGLRVVTTFTPGSDFPEGLAVDPTGNLYVSVTTWGPTEEDPNSGQVWKVTPNGTKTPFGPRLDVGFGLLTGVAFDGLGRLYVAHATYDEATAPGVWQIGRDGSLTRPVDLPVGSFPNGLAFHGGDLYVSDSSLGAIWLVARGGHPVVWSQDPHALLAPGERGLGANGIAFWHGDLYVAVTDAGRIVRIPVGSHGAAGLPVVVSESAKLAGADGIAFDVHGGLYVVSDTNNLLLRLTDHGKAETLASAADGLLYPTTPAFGGPLGHPTTLYVVNGDFFAEGTPNVVAFPAAQIGLPLP